MIDLQDLQEKMEQAYNQLSESTWKYRAQAMVVAVYGFELEQSKLELYRDGKVEGKNQTERDASISWQLEEDIYRLQTEKNKEADLYMKLELNRIRVEHLRSTLRIAEIVYRVNHGSM